MPTKKPKQILSHLNHKVLVHGKQLPLDKLVYIALISPIMALPQLYLIIRGDVSGVSIITWATFLCVAIVWLAYGLKHRIKPIIIVQIAWIIIDTAIVVGLLTRN